LKAQIIVDLSENQIKHMPFEMSSYE
jgi:hypothetical protein